MKNPSDQTVVHSGPGASPASLVQPRFNPSTHPDHTTPGGIVYPCTSSTLTCCVKWPSLWVPGFSMSCGLHAVSVIVNAIKNIIISVLNLVMRLGIGKVLFS